MQVLEMRSYKLHTDQPKTGWDKLSIDCALQSGKRLYVDQNNDVWTYGKHEFVGKTVLQHCEGFL